MTAGSMVVLVVALVPAVVVGGIAGVAARAGGLPLMWAVTVASLMGSAVVLFEGVLAVHLLGGVFDRIDPGTAGNGQQVSVQSTGGVAPQRTHRIDGRLPA